MKKITLLLFILTALIQADIFDKGRSAVGVSVGAGTSFGNTYTLVGLSGNYFLIDNLSVGLSYRGWFGANPTQNELALGATYFVPLNNKFKPYFGAFGRQTFISEYNDFQSYGARAGVTVLSSSNSYVSLGYAYEEYTSCVLNECSTSYPEVIFSLSF